MAGQPASLSIYNRPAPLDAPAGALIVALRAAPEGDPLWTKEGDARWIARNAPMNVLLRAGDLLRIPDLDWYSQIALADEVTTVARRPAITATSGSYPGHRERELNAANAVPYNVTGWFTTNAGPSLHYTLEGPAGRPLDYWRMPDGTTGAQIKAGNHWLDLGEQDPRYQAVIEVVREHEARHPDLASYNNPQAAIAANPAAVSGKPGMGGQGQGVTNSAEPVIADFRRGDLVELPDGERWTVETAPGNATEPVSLCRTGSAGPPLAETSSAPAGRLHLVQPRDLRPLGKGTDIYHIIRQDRRRQPGGWLGEILRPARTVTPAGEAQIQRAAEAAHYLEQWRMQGGQSKAWAHWSARRAAQEEVLRVTAESDPDVQLALRTPRPARADTDSRHAPAAAQEPVAAFARHAVQVLRAWRETDANFLNSQRAELEAADPRRFEAESAGPWDREAALSAVAAALTASDPDVRAAAEERREAHEFNRSLHASVDAAFGGVPDLDPNIGSLAARQASEGVAEADQAYDDAYYRAFDSYRAQVERTWDIDGSFPAVAQDSEVSPDAASWAPPPVPETKTQPPEMTGTKTRVSASSPDPVPHPATEANQAQPSAKTPTTEAGLSARVAALDFVEGPLRQPAPGTSARPHGAVGGQNPRRAKGL